MDCPHPTWADMALGEVRKFKPLLLAALLMA